MAKKMTKNITPKKYSKGHIACNLIFKFDLTFTENN